MAVTIAPADLGDARLVAFLQRHLDELAPTAPPESRHALDLSGLSDPAVRLWVAHDAGDGDRTGDDRDGDLVGTVALARIGDGHLELKSMRTDPERRGQGIGALLLRHAIERARADGASRISLETGSMDFFAPARALYRRYGFTECPPFGSYREDPNSVFMTRPL